MRITNPRAVSVWSTLYCLPASVRGLSSNETFLALLVGMILGGFLIVAILELVAY